MVGHDIIVIGASAGGMEALKHFTHHLPANPHADDFTVLCVVAAIRRFNRSCWRMFTAG